MAKPILDYKVALDWGAKAAEALSEYTAVAVDFSLATPTASYPAATGDLVDGVVLVNAATDEQVRVIVEGIVPVKITTAGTIVKGDLLMADTAGGFVEATTGEIAIARALNAPGADGDVILARLIQPVTAA